ncbi:hypothetical protein EDB83DRAFT_2234425, partial [Lactarius deliciosus]
CFVCNVSNDTMADLDGQADCPRCAPPMKLDQKNTQHVLEHMGAHILHDAKLNASKERCSLCLCPAPMCNIYLTKGCSAGGRYSVDQTKSNCPNLVRFNYRNTVQSSERSPCSNVPVFCSLCKPGSPAVWTYSLHSHYRTCHRLNSIANFPKNGRVELSQSEKDGMKWVWVGNGMGSGTPHGLWLRDATGTATGGTLANPPPVSLPAVLVYYVYNITIV